MLCRFLRYHAVLPLLAIACLGLEAPAQTAPAQTAPAHTVPAQALDTTFARDLNQPIDQHYTEQIHKYTTEPEFLSPLVSYLPASKTVPTPEKVLGDVSGAPNMLPYAEDVYKYFRMLAAASPRVRVVTIGHTEEGREMIAVAIADERLLDQQQANDARLAQLADPRTIHMQDAVASKLIDQSWPVYYITGTIHSPETGAPTALMELAYRLAVDDSPYIQYIRSHMVVLITPVVEVDGRDRMVDLYRWHRAHLDEKYPRLLYWGHYVAHDNNRDAMGMTLDLSRNVLNTFLGWHAQVLHDLHESVPFLYDNTVGDGPYNSWVDPTLADEWAELGWNNISQMQSLGMPGVFTHGDFDTWNPGYLMFLAAMHNGISRLYETFGNGGADTEKRILSPEEYSRTWYRQNPPLPQVLWSQRDNNNYEQTALLTTLSYFSRHTHHFLENYYIKSRNSVNKPTLEGPAAYVLPTSAAELNRQMQLLRVLKRQHVEVQTLTDAVTTTVAGPKRGDKPVPVTLPAGSIVVRMDQPYSRIADALLDHQFWAPDDPQKFPYDDTGWSFTDLFHLKVDRIQDAAILHASMKPLTDAGSLLANGSGSGAISIVPNSGQVTLLSLVYKLKSATLHVADKEFSVDGHSYPAGSLLIANADPNQLQDALRKLALHADSVASMPAVAMHAVKAPRIAVMHTWLSTQSEGWWRYALDDLGIPFDYISTQTAAKDADLRAKYDVIVFAPVGRANASTILNGYPMWNNPMPWEKSALTPNLGRIDSTADMRPGLGYEGLEHLRHFVEQGGLLITSEDTAEFAIETGLAPGVSIAPKHDARVVGTVLQGVFVDSASPVAWGNGATLPVYSANGMAFNVSNSLGRSGFRTLMDPYSERPTGRGTLADSDEPVARPITPADPLPVVKPWQAKPLNEEEQRNNLMLIPADQRPEVILRFAAGKEMLLDGLLSKEGSIAERAIVVNAHMGTGNVLLFGIDPVYRGETIGTYPLVFNAMLNFNALHGATQAAPTQAAAKQAAASAR